MISVKRTLEFNEWLNKESDKSQRQIEARITKIRLYGYFGTVKDLGDGLAELKWKNGRRVYFSAIGDTVVLLIIGGNKNGQAKDIKKARLLIRKYEED
jgi:putative addiction module killer protein